MEPHTGDVKAWVGDINYKFWQYDKVAQSKRQPGSTFKLFDYTAGMSFTYTQLTRMLLIPQCPKSEYSASAPVVQRKTAPRIKNQLG